MMAPERLHYGGAKIILAPMVRFGTLPARLLALEYGADVVFCEEVIDHRILMCKRVENVKLGTVDFQLEADASPPIFRTCPSIERRALVFQMGTSDPQRALSAAKMVQDLVAGIDVNMGCPKAYSVKGGMGAALLTQEAKVKDILSTLVEGLSIPVTCKIRLLADAERKPDLEKTKCFVRACCATGIAGITVHGRTQDERPRHPNHDDAIAILREIAEEFGIPLVANGGSNVIKKRADIEDFRRKTNADSVMLARAAMWDLSIFREEGHLPLDDIVRDYLRLCVRYENPTHNTKYVVQQMLQDRCDTPRGHAIQHSATVREACLAWEMEDIYDEEMGKLKLKEESINDRRIGCKRKMDDENPSMKKSKDDESDTLDETVVRVNVQFVRKEFPVTGSSPKSIVVEYTKKNELRLPTYETFQRDRDKFFRSVLTLGQEKFTSERWEKSKKYAEQAAALAFLTFHNMDAGKRSSPVGDKDSS